MESILLAVVVLIAILVGCSRGPAGAKPGGGGTKGGRAPSRRQGRGAA